ncbi:MAG TPA: bifunctional lysylphosphatidylglycerol flippase/synthetase MprF [Caulobacteraceae bacterium]|jgi:phosphatidylglycerol lysyltransferase|nr:bifunctional lysylphosphatidylglycerol flippase/synthetase MprF [Caulobacteraceae bacterium]
MGWLRDLRPALISAAPRLLALLTAGAGIMLLASGATPSDPARFMWLAEHAPILLIEISHFLSSIIGILLILVAFGLSRRLDAAWAATVALAPTAALLALCKGWNWEEAAALLLLLLVALPLHPAFPRRARLSRMEITPGWLLSAAAAVAGAALAGWWSFQNLDYTDRSVLKVLSDHDAERAIRSLVGAAVLLLGIGVWRLLATPATPAVAGEEDPDYGRVKAILAAAETAEPWANLALRGDKRFLFSPSGESFLMFGVRGRSWVALGSAVGKVEERLDLLWRFRELADAHAARPGIYGVGPEDLPDCVEIGFAIQKIGETAAVPLESFSLEGRKRGNLRRSWRKAGEEGACFEVLDGEDARAFGEDLRGVSDQWLSHHAGGEKTFSMGGFEAPYIWEFPFAIVRDETGRITAFATLWTTARKSSFSIDLMRYADDSPKDVMDFLFVELLRWGREQGFEAFEFGMAPLAGLEDRKLAPMLSRVGRLLYERGEEIYNFRGVRRFKDKYDPVWTPRYLAAPRRWAIPMLLADTGILTSGGVRGLGIRGLKAKPPAPAPAAAPLSI